MTGTVFNIQKFSINDGPGIRTTVFLKGCPLRCIWCHNPESNSAKSEIFYDTRKCMLCGACAKVCPQDAHKISGDGHIFDRTKCSACGACTDACMAEALERAGETKSVEELIKEVLKDKAFYDNSGGGMTLSGGEPMAQLDFTLALLCAAKENGIHTCIETCGFSSSDSYRQIAPYTDIFLYDYKETDSTLHKEYTGVDNKLILENLFMLDSLGAKTILRCPIIPTLNDRDGHLSGIADTANRLKNILEINVEPYHPLGKGKAEMLDRDYKLGKLGFPSEEDVSRWIDFIASKTSVTVKKG